MRWYAPILFLVVIFSTLSAAAEELRMLDSSTIDSQVRSLEENRKPLSSRELSRLAGLYFLRGDRSDAREAKGYFLNAKHAAERAIRSDPSLAQARYWRGMALLGLSSIGRGPGAYLDVRAAIRDLEQVRSQDPGLDFCGASRTLGRIYDEAPSWSLLRDVKRSLSYLEEAATSAPEFPLNRLYLAETLIHVGRSSDASVHLRWIMDHVPPDDADADATDIRRRAQKILAGIEGKGW